MKPFVTACMLPLLALLLAGCQSRSHTGLQPLIHAHAHNDYEHARPLFDALDHGFCSVEADIYLVDGQLLVAHDRDKVTPSRTLQSLYLDPLRKRIQDNGGRVYPQGPECTLLIDIKSDWRSLYPVLRQTLARYPDILTTYEGRRKHTQAIAAVLTGNRSKDMFEGEAVRYAALDGDLDALESDAAPELIPWVSSSWPRNFQWQGLAEMPKTERLKLQTMVAQAHRRGRRIRFWGAPDQPIFWRALRENGVDLINTDDLPGLQKFFQEGR